MDLLMVSIYTDLVLNMDGLLRVSIYTKLVLNMDGFTQGINIYRPSSKHGWIYAGYQYIQT